MPKLVLPVPETTESVLRPVIFDIARQLFDITAIAKDTRIYFPGDLEKDRQPGSSISDTGINNTFGSGPKITIEVEENYETDRILSSAVYRPENLFIFRDDRIETSIKPAYSSTEISINFKHRAIDKASAIRWRDEIKTRISMGRAEHLHDITYHYLIPKEYMVILQEIHRLRENVAPYQEDFDTFFKANLTQRASLLSNLSGTHQEWGISEKQMRIEGWFDFEGAPELGAREDEDDTWVISFTYKFKFDKPIACVMQYPLVIHNQVLSKQFRQTEIPYQVEQRMRSYALSAKSFGMFEKPREVMSAATQPGVAIPLFDEFIPSSIVPETLRVFTILTTVDSVEPLLLFSLKDLGRNWELDADVLSFMEHEAAYMTQQYRSIFSLTLYQGERLIRDGTLTVDADLNVRTTVILPLREYYHVRLAIVKNLALVDPAALVRAREIGGVAFLKILDAIDPTIQDVCRMPPLIGDRHMPRDYLACAMDHINRATIAQGDGQIRQFNTVMSLFVEANKREE